VINVGSSAHLRATHALDEDITLGHSESYITAMSNAEDKDLSTYAQSKLALMQFSTLLRHSIKTDTIQIYDAHPGLVWTPLLRNHIGEGATNFLRKSGLANLTASRSGIKEHHQQQVYFENGKSGGYATPKSREHVEALKL
jgi:NAD(P)-dependent dehydrogenase (short-subunit alcohol dehydrogenase family)